ncbi:MAG: nucleotidyl transferase AbiEii/AbiGii toxin family protein [Planctomycetales bacterium]|nr:nucleotidyl transferase AbiEii/AbiGii toxin family protein [Planctomycetales bacterium]
MEKRVYPSSLSEIDRWSQEQQVSTEQARSRFIEFVILSCIASYRITRQGMVLKGGNALRFVYQSARSTKDLDFTADTTGIPDNEEGIRRLLDESLAHAERQFNVKARCQRVKRNPKRPEATWPTYDVKIGYQLPTDRYFHDFGNRHVPSVIPVEISFNDLVCDTQTWADIPDLRVCSLLTHA